MPVCLYYIQRQKEIYNFFAALLLVSFTLSLALGAEQIRSVVFVQSFCSVTVSYLFLISLAFRLFVSFIFVYVV